MYDITFTFNRCHRNWAAGTPHKYESDWKYLTITDAQWKFHVKDKLTSGLLVPPTPGPELD